MDNNKGKIEEQFSMFNLDKLFNDDIQLSYKGPFDSQVLAILGGYIRSHISLDSGVGQKLFKIFIELAQNISFYSADSHNVQVNDGVGTLVLLEYDDYIDIFSGNTLRSTDVDAVLDRIEIINSLDREGLREYKREQRNLPRGKLGGAHIGLIQVALTSANPLDMRITPIDDDYSFFSLKAKVDKVEI